MTEHPLTFLSRPTDSPQVRARLATVGPVAERNRDAINKRITSDFWRNLTKQANALIHSNHGIGRKLEMLWKLADSLMAFNGRNVACKRGCSHCCHIAVAVVEPEAKLIGRKIGRAPADAPGRYGFQGFDYGYHNPCTFLRDGECSIYEYRPLACRLQYSLDDDALLCNLTPPHSVTVPLLNATKFDELQVAILAHDGGAKDWEQIRPEHLPKYDDIRQWFPK